jgi:hypothetical protein
VSYSVAFQLIDLFILCAAMRDGLTPHMSSQISWLA